MREMDEEEREERFDLEMEMMEEREELAEELAEEQAERTAAAAAAAAAVRPAPYRWGSAGIRWDEACDRCHRETQVDNDTSLCRSCGS